MVKNKLDKIKEIRVEKVHDHEDGAIFIGYIFIMRTIK